MGSFLRGLILVVLGVLFSVPAFAQTMNVRAIANTPIGWTSQSQYLGTITYEASLAATPTAPVPAGARPLYYQRKLTVAKSVVATLARQRLKQIPAILVSAAIWTAAIEGAGLFIDWITGQVVQTDPLYTDPNYIPLPVGVTGWCNPSFCGYGSAFIAADVFKTNGCTGCTYVAVAGIYDSATQGVGTGGAIFLYNKYDPAGLRGQMWIYPTYSAGAHHFTVAEMGQINASTPPATPAAATDTQLVDAVSAEQKMWDEPFKWPSGKPKIVTGMPVQMAEVATQARVDMGVPLASGTTDPVYTAEDAVLDPATAASETVGTVTKPETAPSASASASLEFPVFCTWAETVCAALDFLTAEPTVAETTAPVLPEVAVPVPTVPFESGLGPGTCPGAVDVEFSFVGVHHIYFSYQPMCDFAALLNPLFILMGAVLSAFILSGVRKRL